MNKTNPKKHFLVLLLIVIAIVTSIVIIIQKNKPNTLITQKELLEVYNYRLEQDSLTTSDNELIRTEITNFFSSTYPSFSSITFSNYEILENQSEFTFSLTSDTEKSFTGKLTLSDSSFTLKILSSSSEEVFSLSKEKTKPNTTNESLASALIDRLPYSSTLTNNIEFLVYYLGGDENTLEISIDSEKIYPEFCEEAKEKTMQWLSNINYSFNGTLTKDNLLCQEK